MEQVKEIAERLKGLRTTLQYTPEYMAQMLGIGVNEYLQYETGDEDFAFSFLFNCAKLFGIDVTELISGESQTLKYYQVTRKNQGLNLVRRKGFDYRHLASRIVHHNCEPFVVTAKYDEELANSAIRLSQHRGEELDYVLSGRLLVQVGDYIEELGPGDAIYYDSGKPHGMVAIGGKNAEFLAVVMEEAAEDGTSAYVPIVETKSETKVKATTLDDIIGRFVKVKEDEVGRLVDIRFTEGKTFNFAYDIVDELAKATPDKLAMLWLSKDKHEKRFSFRDMSELSSKTANFLSSCGIKKGDKVMLVLKRNYQFWLALLGLHKLGAIAVPATNQLKVHDYEYRFKNGDIDAIIATSDGDVCENAEAAFKSVPVAYRFVVNGNREGWIDFDKGVQDASSQLSRIKTASTDDAVMFFTSGTTGYPRLAVHSQTYPLGHFVTGKYWHNVVENGLHFTIADTGWGKALWGKIYGQWMSGSAVMTYDFDRFDAKDILPLFEKYNITTFCAPPTMYRFFIKDDLSKYNFPSLKYCTTAGEALNPEVYQQLRKALDLEIMEGFGQTETTLSIATLRGMTVKPGSMGMPSPMFHVEIHRTDGKKCDVGETGEIVIKAERKGQVGLFSGYYNDEARTASVWHDGFYHTGDMAWCDEDGYYWYVGRIDDLIKSSGYRIGPFEVESVIMELPYVLECAVTGVPDPDPQMTRGQIVKATIVLTKDVAPTEEIKKEIQKYVKDKTAPYKYPRIVEFVESLPKTISGKIKRTDLRNN